MEVLLNAVPVDDVFVELYADLARSAGPPALERVGQRPDPRSGFPFRAGGGDWARGQGTPRRRPAPPVPVTPGELPLVAGQR